MPCLAGAIPTAEVVIEDKTAIIPDVSSLTLDSFGTLPDSEKSAADVLSLADVERFIDLRDMTIGMALNHWSEKQGKSGALSDFSFLSTLTLSEVATMTHSYDTEIKDFPIAETILKTFLNNPVLTVEKRLTLAQVLDRYPEIGEYKLNFLDLSNYRYNAIPDLISVPIMAIPDWEQIEVAQIPGISNVPLLENVQLTGEIVTLSTEPKDGRIAIELIDEDKSILVWSEDPSEGITPFGSYSITPELAGESIAVSAYFLSCNSADGLCKRVGPFEHPSYKKGDPFYVSEADWAFAKKEKGGTVGFSRKAVSAPKSAAIEEERLNIYLFIAISALAGIAFIGLVLSLTNLTTIKKGRERQ